MATVIRNPFGDALQQAAGNILQFIMEKRRMQGIKEERELSNAVRSFGALIQLPVGEGRTLGELTYLHGPLERILGAQPGGVVADPVLSGIVLNPGNPESTLNRMITGFIDGLPIEPGDTPEQKQRFELRQSFLESAAAKVAGAPGKTLSELTAARVKAGEEQVQSGLNLNALEVLRAEMNATDKEGKLSESAILLRGDIGRTLLGLEQPVRFSVGTATGPQTFQFDSNDAANQAIRLIELMTKGEEESGRIMREMTDDFRVSLEKVGITLSPPIASEIIRAQTSGNLGNLARRLLGPEKGKGLSDPDAIEKLSATAGMQSIGEAIKVAAFGEAQGARSIRQMLRSLGPAGESIINLLDVSDLMEQRFGKEAAGPLSEGIAKFLKSRNINIAQLKGFGGGVNIPFFDQKPSIDIQEQQQPKPGRLKMPADATRIQNQDSLDAAILKLIEEASKRKGGS